MVGSALVSAIAQSLDQNGSATRATKAAVLGLVARLAAALRASGRSRRALGMNSIDGFI